MLNSLDMAENKTTPTAASVDDYIAARASEQQAADCRELSRLFETITGSAAAMWGPSIVGFGTYAYTYESGRSGTAPLAGYAIRGRELVLYLAVEGDTQQALLATLGKHKMGKSCLYFKQLADLDLPTLQQLAAGSVAAIRQRYGHA